MRTEANDEEALAILGYPAARINHSPMNLVPEFSEAFAYGPERLTSIMIIERLQSFEDESCRSFDTQDVYDVEEKAERSALLCTGRNWQKQAWNSGHEQIMIWNFARIHSTDVLLSV